MFQKSSPIDWLVVGLGNPGQEYEATRHNVGFRTADELALRHNLQIQRLKYHALTTPATLGTQRVLLMKPTTYMNSSGEAVREAAGFFKIPPEHILIISDDVSLPVGKLRIRRSGSAGGHNGLKSIIARLGSDAFPRIKIGVGEKPHPDYDMAAWVLSRFVPTDRKIVDEAIRSAADAVELLLEKGADQAMSQFN
ncbi:MAG: aminoacyl-tRNA hydrolase [Evtepia sp.]